MRPGPGLVVMALAFISGARRGSTSSISSKTTITTSSLPPPPPTPLPLPTTTTTTTLTPPPTQPPSASASATLRKQTSSSSSSFTAAAAATTVDTITPTSSPFSIYEHFGFLQSPANEAALSEDHQHHNHHHQQPPQQQQQQHHHQEPAPFNFFNTFYSNNFLQRSTASLDSPYPYSSANIFAYTFPLPSHLTHHYDDPRARSISNTVLPTVRHPRRATAKFRRRRKRRTRSASVNYKGGGAEAEAGENLNDSDDSTSQSTAVDSGGISSHSRDSVLGDQPLARGLPVHFPSLTADSSRSFDEDDIFALVAEDDLLSEESFDRLVKLTDDKIGDTNEDDYSSGTETVVSSSSLSSSSSTSGSGSGASEVQDTNQQNAIEDFERLQQNEDPTPIRNGGDKSKRPTTHQAQESEHEHEHEQEREQQQTPHDSEREREQDDANVETLYNAHLVSNDNEKVVTISDDEHTTTQGNTKAELRSPDRPRSILESDFPLTRLNPWISACDLAQPGPQSAPDLQGECSAGTLPVAWVDEGPGPPKCLKSCKNDDEEEETPFTNKLNKDKMINSNNNSNNNNNNSNNNKHKNKNDNKLNNKLVGYTTTTNNNNLNIKLRNSQPTISHSSNTDSGSGNKDSTNSGSNSNKRPKQQRSQKLLNPFNYYQIHKNYNNNNNKMSKTRRNSNETPTAPADKATAAALAMSSSVPANKPATSTTSAAHTASANNTTNNTTNILQATLTNTNSNSNSNSNNDGDEIYEFMQQDAADDDVDADDDDVDVNDDIDVNVHNDAAVADNAAFVMQLQQFQQQNQANNNIVKMKLSTSANVGAAATSSANQQFELKYNHLQSDLNTNGNGNGNNNNNKRYHNTYQLQVQSVNSNHNNNYGPGNQRLAKSHNAQSQQPEQQQHQQQHQQQQQQCLEYLGDSAETMPMHLCTHLTSPSHILAQLRHLRLRNCCERNVYSALHTLALNATLGGGEQCIRILEDLMELDALASRITCGLAEILFRFDCRQVYSIIHQCDDCKEAYRRWVCSTLVPYFAEPNDVIKPPKFYQTATDSGHRHHHHQPEQQQHLRHYQTTMVAHSNSNNNNKSPTTSFSSNNKNNNTNMASNMTTSHNNNNNNNSNNGTRMSSTILTKAAAAVAATSNFITATTANNNNNNNYDDIQHLHQQQRENSNNNINNHHHVKRRNTQQHHTPTAAAAATTIQFNDKLNNNYIPHDTAAIHQRPPHTAPRALPATATSAAAAAATAAAAAVTTRKTRALTFDDIILTDNVRTSRSSTARSRRSTTTGTGHAGVESARGSNSFGQNNHNKSTNKRRKRNDDTAPAAASFYMGGIKPMQSQQQSTHEQRLKQQQKLQPNDKVEKQQSQQQSINFISTANSEDSLFVKDPVISKLLKRSKRKIEFRKRRRIRPCLSVCQTVEQKCPYLLPADRAPAMPTQYAGEPTFLCLDYNIAETEEQLRKASHGPNECCYTYCKTAADGICTYCNDFLDTQDIELEAERLNRENERKIYNITLKARNQEASDTGIRVETKIHQKLLSANEERHLKMSTVAIAVRNDTLALNVTRLAERLPYYAYCEGVYYYDDDMDDMPDVPYSEDCIALPTVTSRCTIPYYASNYITSGEVWGSYRKHSEAQKLMVWLSTLLCLWSCYTARALRLRRLLDKRQHQQQQHQLTQQQHDLQMTEQQPQNQQHNNNSNNNTAFDRKPSKQCKNCANREIMQSANDSKKTVIVWYDITENRILIIYLTTVVREGGLINKTDNDDNDYDDYVTSAVVDVKNDIRLKGEREKLRNFREFVRRIQQIDLLYSKNALILLIHYTNRLKSFMQQTQPHRKRKLTHLKWWCWSLYVHNMRRQRSKQMSKTRTRTRRTMRTRAMQLNMTMKLKKLNCSNVSFSHRSCSLTSCSCNNNINNTYSNNKKNNNNNNVKTNNENMKKFKFNFSTCNFKDTNYNNNNTTNNNNGNHNKSNDTNVISKSQQQQFSIIKLQCNTTRKRTTTHTTSSNIISSHMNINHSRSVSNKLTSIHFSTPSHNDNNIKMHHEKLINNIYKTQQIFNSFKYNTTNTSHKTTSTTTFDNATQQHQPHLLHRHWTTSRSRLQQQQQHPFHHHQQHQPNLLIASQNCRHFYCKPIQVSLNSKINNYRYFYDYNFNINDWWRRHWWWCPCSWHWWDCGCRWRSLWRRYWSRCCCRRLRRRRLGSYQNRDCRPNGLQHQDAAASKGRYHEIRSRSPISSLSIVISINQYNTTIL